MKIITSALLAFTVLVYALEITIYLTGSRVDCSSWLDLPAFVCFWWIFLASPIVVLVATITLRHPRNRSTWSSRVGLAVAAAIFCGWIAVWVLLLTATGGRST